MLGFFYRAKYEILWVIKYNVAVQGAYNIILIRLSETNQSQFMFHGLGNNFGVKVHHNHLNMGIIYLLIKQQ